jgi:hypothetical protein
VEEDFSDPLHIDRAHAVSLEQLPCALLPHQVARKIQFDFVNTL